MTGNVCKEMYNYKVKKIITKIFPSVGKVAKLKCDSGFELDGLTCVKDPPDGYKRTPGNLVSYYVKDSVSYPMGTGKLPSQDNSACDGLKTVIQGIGTCTGNDLNCSGCACIKQPNERYCPDEYNLEALGCWDKDCEVEECLPGLGCVKVNPCAKIPILKGPARSRCPTGMRNDGLNCWEDFKCTGGTKTRLAPRSCPDGYEFDDTRILCYPKCREGYRKRPGDVVLCWNTNPPIKTIMPGERAIPSLSCDDDEELFLKTCHKKCPPNSTRTNMGYCKTNCPSEYTKDSRGNCIPPDVPALSCEPGKTAVDNVCTDVAPMSCESGKVFSNNECLDICSRTITTNCINLECPEGSRLNKTTNKCESNITTNPKCLSTETFIRGFCYPPCTTGYFMNPKTGDCMENCQNGYSFDSKTGWCESNNPTAGC